ncbi:MAG: 2-iminobutanoate/2-iminopropanoate deaminase [Limisphaerales bacterium]|jgi:2-iminobutanoate/2-iminopropanoate deaminase
MKHISTSEAPAAIGPYSQAVLANGCLYMSGQVAFDPATGELQLGDIETETKRVMDNLGAVLKEAGMTHSNLVKCTIFLKDMNDYAGVNEVYGSYFQEGKAPAREAVQVSRLPKDVNVEISAIAYAG